MRTQPSAVTHQQIVGDKIENALISARLVIKRLEAAKREHQLADPVEAALYLDAAAAGVENLRGDVARAVWQARQP